MREDEKLYVYDLSQKEIGDAVRKFGGEGFRGKQIYEGIYKKFAESFSEIPGLPKTFTESLSKKFTFSHLAPAIDLVSSDGWTRKILFNLPDNCQIETVLMEYEKRRTACISTQAGCGLGCTFCATGQGGLQRNISAGEIVEQAIWFERALRRTFPPLTGDSGMSRLTNLVYMGMGEPFANYREVMKSIKILTDREGYNFGARRITVSTVGLVPEILKFAEETASGGQVNLAVSLHAADDKLRNTMLPINKKYPLKVVIPACREYTKKTRRRISFEWALIDEVNDTEEQAKLLAKLIKGMLCHVNLIPLNPTRGFSGHESNRIRIKKFREILSRHGIPNTLRLRRGIDINAGCGQLRQATS